MDFSWAFVLSSGGRSKTIEWAAPPAVKAGDNLRIYLRPASPLYIYIFLFDSEKKLAVLFPAEYGQPASGNVVIPGLEEWLTFDESKGTEEFTLLASAVRLQELEKLAADFQKKPGGDTQAKVIDCIKGLRRTQGGIATAGEKGVLFAGTFVTRGEAIPGNAVSVHALDFYSKTLRLRHE